MSKIGSALTSWFVLAFVLPGCDVIGDIFAAGVWVGLIAVVAVIAGIVWLITRLFA